MRLTYLSPMQVAVVGSVGALMGIVLFLWWPKDSVFQEVVVEAVPIESATVKSVSLSISEEASESEEKEVTPPVRKLVTKRHSKSKAGLLKRVGLPENLDLVAEYMDGLRDKAKFERARDFLLSMGYNVEDAEWHAAVANLDPKWSDTDSEKWKEEQRKGKIGGEAWRKANPPLTTEELSGLASAAEIDDRALAALLDPERISLESTIEELIAAAIPNDRFLDDPSTIERIREADPDSAWGSMLGAKLAIYQGDWDTAMEQVSQMLEQNMEPRALGAKEGLTEFLMENRGYPYEQAKRWNLDGLNYDSLSLNTSQLASEFYQEALRRREAGTDDWVLVAANGLALAEASADPLDASRTEDSLISQKRFLDLLEDDAQRYLNEPVGSVTEALQAEAAEARSLMIEVLSIRKELNGPDLITFEQIRREQGDTVAIDSFR